VTLGDPAEPRRSAAGGAIFGNSAIFDDMCPPRARPNYLPHTQPPQAARFSAICMGPRGTNIRMGPRRSEMSECMTLLGDRLLDTTDRKIKLHRPGGAARARGEARACHPPWPGRCPCVR
jgi:hypothetical protein